MMISGLVDNEIVFFSSRGLTSLQTSLFEFET